MTTPLALPTIVPAAYRARSHQWLEQMGWARLLQRLWQKDATLWSQDPREQDAIRHRLGWLSIAPVMLSHCARIEAAAEDLRRAGFTHAVLLGMGGSSLFAEVCQLIFGHAPGWLDVEVLDSTDPTAIATVQRRLPLGTTVFLVSSKSGTTAESSALGDYFYEQLRQQVGPPQAGRHFIAITDAGTPLETLGRQRNFRHLFTHGPDTGEDVGGRFSAVTCFGLVPAALMGLDIRRLLDRVQAMLAACQRDSAIVEHPVAGLFGLLSEAVREGRDHVTIVAAKPLAPFVGWLEQLLAECTGKSGTGVIPVYGESMAHLERSAGHRLIVEFQLASDIDPSLARQTERLADAGHPVARILWSDRYALGGEIMRWFITTALIAHVLDINAFDEPNVKESKDRTHALLAQYARTHALPVDPPLFTDGSIAVYGASDHLGARQDVTEVLREFLGRCRPGDYVAVLSFLPRTSQLDAAVEAFRHRVAAYTNATTTLGFGPRYLHSSGQLHKGGPDRVLMVYLTAEDPIDLPIPGKPYTFSVLKQAQALGDVQAVMERGRRVLRLHVNASPDEALARLDDALAAVA